MLKTAEEPSYLAENFETVKRVAALKMGEISVLLLRPTGRHPAGHPGGALIEADSENYRDLETLVTRVTTGTCPAEAVAEGCESPEPGPRQLRRLTRYEYDNTVRDLFGITGSWGGSFAPDVVVNGFDNNARSLVVTPLFADQLRRAAEDIAGQVISSVSTLVPCVPAGDADAACATEFVQSFGKRAFRRPFTAAEVSRYVALQQGIAAEDGFAEGVRYVLQAMLQSPNFLYRLELGEADGTGRYRLTPYEIATELSYLVWGTLPDAELFAAAESGALGDPQEIARQARRLLADPRSTPAVSRFVEQWLGLTVLPNVVKDTAAFPAFDEVVRAAMVAEAAGLVDHVRRRGSGALPELFTATYGVVTPELAAFYGMPATSGVAQFPDGAHAGVLTLGGVLATYSFATHTSPIHRGKYVRERLLCQELPPPPADLMVQPVSFDPALPTREQFAAHAAQEPCKSCHRLMDPIGFAFESFDPVGRYRASEDGMMIDTRGEIVSSPATDGTFNGVAELGARLAESPDASACYVRQWVRYAWGLEESDRLACALDHVVSRFVAGGLKLDDLIVELTQSPHFVERSADEPSDDPGPAPIETDAGAAPQPSASPEDSGTPAPPHDLDVVERLDSQWAMGSCHSVTVTNTGDAPVTWSLTLTVTGTLSQNWSSNATANGSDVTFTGVDYNATLGPGESTNFGYCVSV